MRGLLSSFVTATVCLHFVKGYDDRGDSQINQGPNCDSLHQSSEIWPTEVGSAVLDLRWVLPGETAAEKDKVVLALTQGQDGHYGGHLYRSENYGKPGSWEKVNKALLDALDQVEKSSIGPEEHELGILEMHFNPKTPHHIFLHANEEFHWTTRDYGRSFKRVKSPGDIPGSSVYFKLHPKNPDLILARVRAKECSVPGQAEKCSVDLYVTEDFGESWTSLTHNAKGKISAFVDFEWGARMHPDPRYADYNEKTIFATVYEGRNKAPTGQWDENINFVRSDDFFVSDYTTSVKCGNAFEIIAGKIFLAVPNDCPYDSTGAVVPSKERGSGANAVIYVSEDFGKTFAESCVPVRHLGDKGYELRETHDRQGVYVLIDHDEEEDVDAAAPVYNLYTCGVANATLFSLSLERVFSVDYYGQRLADWHRVEGLPGIFITNQLDSAAMSVQTMKTRGWKDFVETKATFNGGGHWEHLPAPDVFRNEKCNLCSKSSTSCSLHIHGASSWVGGASGRPSVYSHPSAPGMVMASGNTGHHLNFDADFQCTWLSRDGGISWEDVAHGMFIYEYGDHGGLIVMGRHRNEGIPTDTIYYSFDQGLCWHSVKLGEAMYLENIRVEPAGASHTFILHGEQCEKNTRWTSQGFNCTFEYDGEHMPRGVMYTIDFHDIRKDWNNCLKEDYEDWSPPTPSTCLLGHSFVFERRKRDSKCFNSKEYERVVDKKICKCTNTDVECDYGYFRKDYFDECQPIENIAEQRSCPALEDGYPMSASHLRVVHGDNCSDPKSIIGDDYDRVVDYWKAGHHSHHHHHWKIHDNSKGFSFGNFLLTTILVIAGAFGLFFTWLKCFASEDMRDTVLEILSPVTGCCGSSLGWLSDCIMGHTSRLATAASGNPKDEFFRPLAEGDGLDFDESLAENAPLFTNSETAENRA